MGVHYQAPSLYSYSGCLAVLDRHACSVEVRQAKFRRSDPSQAIAGGAVIYVISDEGFKIEGYTWLLLYFVSWLQFRPVSIRLGFRVKFFEF